MAADCCGRESADASAFCSFPAEQDSTGASIKQQRNLMPIQEDWKSPPAHERVFAQDHDQRDFCVARIS